MCILCVASRWSRRIVTMLPWLVIPLIILWALSQLLPPGFRFEVTSPRLACVAVLLVSLGWYEIVMPKVSAWRARRRALLRERKRIEAQEVAKWRKEATRRCRNCYTPYKDQAPGGGKFMCTYCGHVSKRPVLDIPTTNAGNTFSMTGSTTGLVNGNAFLTSRNPKIWNGRGSNGLGGGRTWAGGRPWIDGGSWGINGSWFGSSWPGSAYYFGTAGTGWPGAGTFMGNGIFTAQRCSTGESYFGIFWFLLRLLSYLIFVVGWIWRKLLKAGFSGDGSLDRGHRGQSRSDDSVPSPETRVEKARRKAEEKRAARLEKEQLEAEERKQREEVARLVEERRRLRDEILEAEKESEREAAAEREREIRREREAERRRQEKMREKEKNQMKEKCKDQDLEEQRKRKGKEFEKKSDPDKNESDDPKTTSESTKAPKVGKQEVRAGEAGTKGHVSKWTGSKYLGSAKTSFWGRNFSSTNVTGKATKTAIPGTCATQSNSNSNIESGRTGNKVSGSAWNRLQWSNVWGRTSNKAPCDASKTVERIGHAEKKTDPSSSDMVKDCSYSDTAKEPSGSEAVNNAIGNEVVKDLIHGSVISAPLVQQPQQPIAPPSSVSDTWDNLFSGPVCFPPVEFPVDSGLQEHRKSLDGAVTQEVTYTSPALSTHSYFEAPGIIAPPQVSCTYSDHAEAAVSSLPPSVSSSLNMIDFTGPDIQSSLSEIGPLADPVMSNTAINFGTSLNPVSPGDVSGMIISRENDYISKSQVLDPWNSPTTPIESISSNSREGIWNSWSGLPSQQMNFLPSSPWDSSFHEPLQAFSPNLREERSYNSGSQSQPTFFLQEQTDRGSRLPYCEPSRPIPTVGCNNWQDVSSLESMMHVWEDADVNQRVPPEFVDCITHSLMQNPVITADGHSYERSAIEEWLKSHDTSPKTGEVLPPPPNGIGVDKTLRPNHILRGQIIEYLERLSRRGSLEGLINTGWNTDAASISSSSWPPKAGIQTRSSIRGFYPTPSNVPVWSYNVTGV